MALAAVLFGVLAAVPACSHPKQGSALPPAQPTPASPSASPSPSSTMSDKQQIEARAREYFLQITEAINSGNTNQLKTMAVPGCPCARFAKYIDSVWSRGGRIVAPNYYQISRVGDTTMASKVKGFTNVTYTLAKETDYSMAGSVTSTYPAQTRSQIDSVDFVKVDGQWLISDVQNNG